MLRTCLLFATLGLLPVVAVAQPIKTDLDARLKPFILKYERPENASTRTAELRDSGITGAISKTDKEAIDGQAQYLVYRVTEPKYHAPAEGPPETVLKPRQPSLTVQSLLTEARGYILPLVGAPPTEVLDEKKRAYVCEFGAAMDAHIVKTLTHKPNVDPTIRVAAMRMLIVACESGAPAHWDTVLKMLKNPKIEFDVAYYALKAAETLLGAYEYKRLWKQPNGQPWIAEDKYVDFVETVESWILKPSPFLNTAYLATSQYKPGDAVDLKNLNPDEIVLFQNTRLSAIRALGRLKAEVIGGKAAKEIRPALTLVKVALRDASIKPTPSNRECAEAAIGLLTVLPDLSLSADDAMLAIAYGVLNFAGPRAADQSDKSTHYLVYAERLKQALATWKAYVDKTQRLGAATQKLAGTFAETLTKHVFDPLSKSKPGGPVPSLDLTQLSGWITTNTPNEKAGVKLYKDKDDIVEFPKN